MINGLHHTYLTLGKDKTPSHLFFVLHGYGASAAGIANLAQAFIGDYPNALFLVPQAPHPFPWDPEGAMWFEVGDLNPKLLQQGLKECLPALQDDIHRLQKFYQKSSQDTIVMGFSQGAMIAMALNHHQDLLAETVVAFSGGLPFNVSRCTERERYLVVHGTQDEVVVPARGKDAVEILRRAGGSVEFKLIDGLDHSINYEAVEVARTFLKNVLRPA